MEKQKKRGETMRKNNPAKTLILSAFLVLAAASISLNVREAQAQSPEAAAAKLAEARDSLSKGETDRAIALLTEAQAADPNNAEVYHFRGVAYAAKENFPAAATDLEKAIELNPANAQSHYYAGMVYGRLGQTDKMVNHFETFLRLAPDAPEAARVQSLLRSVR
jgi:Flp pilus assembly protein TadD